MRVKSEPKYRPNSGGVLAEFGPVLFIFFMIILFPMLDLIGFGCAMTSMAFIASQCVAKAGQATTYSAALSQAAQEAQRLQASGFATIGNLKPVGGFLDSGVNLYVHESEVNSTNTKTYGPNTVMTGPINTTKNVYQYAATFNCDVSPFASLSAVPFLKDIPGVGKPARMNYTARKTIEYPQGLTQ